MPEASKSNDKDYASCIDFPVEIMGKDGRVRFYTFEESIRLYQRRIRLARLRYSDSMRIEREVEHCAKRIAQLRRSFFARYGWESFQFVDGSPANLSLELTAEMSAYLRRIFGCGTHTAPAQIQLLDSDNAQWIFSITVGTWSGLLYLFQNEEMADSTTDMLRQSEMIGQERVLDVSKLLDVVILLTAVGNDAVPFISDLPDVKISQTSFGLEALHQGRVIEALAHFMLVIEQNPYVRQAYWAGSILAEQLRIHEQAHLLLCMGVAYFPSDVSLWCRKASIELRLNQWDAFQASMDKIRYLDKGFHGHLLGIVGLYLAGHHGKALHRLKSFIAEDSNPILRPSALWLQKELIRGQLIGRLVAISMLVWAYLIVVGHPIFLVGLGLSIALLFLVRNQQQSRLYRALRGQGFFQLTLLAGKDIHEKRNRLLDEH